MKLKPNKKLGQNFLIDKNVIKKICNFAYIDKNSDLLEIGPGTGNLTQELLNKKPKHFYSTRYSKLLEYIQFIWRERNRSDHNR